MLLISFAVACAICISLFFSLFPSVCSSPCHFPACFVLRAVYLHPSFYCLCAAYRDCFSGVQQDGGGVYSSKRIDVTGSQFFCNRAARGGGLAVDAYSAEIDEATKFQDNSAALCSEYSTGKGAVCTESEGTARDVVRVSTSSLPAR